MWLTSLTCFNLIILDNAFLWDGISDFIGLRMEDNIDAMLSDDSSEE